MREFFTETLLAQFTFSCDVSLLDDPAVKHDLGELVVAIRGMEEDGQPLFTMVIENAGAVDLRLRHEKTDREVKILRNRINQMMKDIRTRSNAA